MSITTYAELRAAVANRLSRTDLATGGVNVTLTPEFIAFAEVRINRDLNRLGAGELVSTALTTSAESVDLSADFNGMRFLALSGSSIVRLDYKPPETFYGDWPSQAVGVPRAYTVHGKDGVSDVLQARFRPIPDATYNLVAYYYKKVATLVGGADGGTNWMLTNNPDVYLYAALIEAATWAQDDGAVDRFGKLYAFGIDALKALDDARRVGNASPRASPGVKLLRGM